jgi:hypothetical protein
MISRCPMETCKPSRDKYGTILNEKVKEKKETERTEMWQLTTCNVA